eukprot:81704_1
MTMVEENTEGLATETFLESHGLHDLVSPFKDALFELDDLMICTESDIRNICDNEFKLKTTQKMRLLKAMQSLPGSKLNQSQHNLVDKKNTEEIKKLSKDIIRHEKELSKLRQLALSFPLKPADTGNINDNDEESMFGFRFAGASDSESKPEFGVNNIQIMDPTKPTTWSHWYVDVHNSWNDTTNPNTSSSFTCAAASQSNSNNNNNEIIPAWVCDSSTETRMKRYTDHGRYNTKETICKNNTNMTNNNQRIGTKDYQFTPHIIHRYRGAGIGKYLHHLYYQHICVSDCNVFEPKSSEELRFEDQYQAPAVPSNTVCSITDVIPSSFNDQNEEMHQKKDATAITYKFNSDARQGNTVNEDEEWTPQHVGTKFKNNSVARRRNISNYTQYHGTLEEIFAPLVLLDDEEKAKHNRETVKKHDHLSKTNKMQKNVRTKKKKKKKLNVNAKNTKTASTTDGLIFGRKELLRRSKIQLAKQCRLHHLPSNGTKGDMVNRLLRVKNTN